MWPSLLDTSKEECMKTLRRLELEAYGSLVTALRAQGSLTNEKNKLLKDVATALYIPPERHRAEVRRAVNDEQLTTIAEHIEGCNTSHEWSTEGRRKIRLVPRVVPQTAYLEVARRVADATYAENTKLPWPAATAREPAKPEPSRTPTQMRYEPEERMKKRRRLSQETPLITLPSSTTTIKHRPQKSHPMSKIQQVYKLQNRLQTDSAIMPPPQVRNVPRTTATTQIKTLTPIVRQRPAHNVESQENTPKLVSQSVSPVASKPRVTLNKTAIKFAQTNSSPAQKLVIVSASQNVVQNVIKTVNSFTSEKNSTGEVIVSSSTDIPPTTTAVTTKSITKMISSNQVIVSKSQLMPLQSVSGDKTKVLTVRPQGSIIVPLQPQNQSQNVNQFSGVSVPVLQGVQWKTIPGKSTVKLLPLTGNTKIIKQGSGSVGSGPIYVMSKPGNIIVNNKPVIMNNESSTLNMNSGITHIRPVKSDDIKSNVLIVRKAGAIPSTATMTRDSVELQDDNISVQQITITDAKSSVLHDALRASGVTPADDDIETQISQYTVIPRLPDSDRQNDNFNLEETVAMLDETNISQSLPIEEDLKLKTEYCTDILAIASADIQPSDGDLDIVAEDESQRALKELTDILTDDNENR